VSPSVLSSPRGSSDLPVKGRYEDPITSIFSKIQKSKERLSKRENSKICLIL